MRGVKLFRHRIFEVADASTSRTGGSGGPGAEVRVMQVGDIPRLKLEFGDIGRRFEGRLQEGNIGVVAQAPNDGAFLGYGWLALSEASPRLVNDYFQLPPQSGLIHWCRVAPVARGRGIYGAMVSFLGQVGRKRGHKVYIDCSVDNVPALRALSRLGCVSLGRGCYLVVLGRLVLAKHPLRLQ